MTRFPNSGLLGWNSRPAGPKMLFASKSAEALLQRNQLADIEAAFSCTGSIPPRHVGRTVVERQITDEHGDPMRVYIKLNWGRRRLWPRMTDLITGQFFQTLPEREWKGIGQLKSIGLNVPGRLAMFQDGLLNARTAVIIKEVPPPASIDQLIADGTFNRLPKDERASLLHAVISTINKIHEANLGWRGTGSRHFYPQLKSNGQWSLWLIDCEGVHRRATPKVIERDFCKLVRSMQNSGADPTIVDQLRKRIGQSKRCRTIRAACNNPLSAETLKKWCPIMFAAHPTATLPAHR